MADLASWPDPHEVLRLALADLGAVRIFGPRTPPDFRDNGLPVIHVRRIGGTNLPDKITDVPRINVDVYHSTYADSRDLAEAIRQRLLSKSIRTDVGVIDRCEVEVAPIENTYPDPNVWVHSAVYRLSFRRR